MKIIGNSTYGFFGQRTEDRENLKIYRSGDVPVYDYLSRNALIEEADHGRTTCLRVVEDMDLKDFNVGVAASIHIVGAHVPVGIDGRHQTARRGVQLRYRLDHHQFGSVQASGSDGQVHPGLGNSRLRAPNLVP